MEASLTQTLEHPVATQSPTTPTPGRPALALVVALALGIAASNLLPLHAGWYAFLGLLLAILTAVLARKPVADLLVLLALAIAGLTLAQTQKSYFAPDHLIHACPPDGTLTRLRLQIAEPSTSRQGTGPANQPITSVPANAIAAQPSASSNWQPARGRVLLRITGRCPALRPGQTVEAIGQLTPIEPPSNPGTYDWQKHFAQDGILLRFHVADARVLTIVHDSGEPLLWKCRRLVREAFARGFSAGHQLDRATLQTLLLGDPDDRLEEVWADFRSSGTSHHLSISGMHIALFALVVAAITRCILLSPRKAMLLTLACVILYAAMTRPSPPVIRSVLLCIAVGAAKLLGRNTDPVQCLFIGVLGMLIWNPMDLANPGFQLSVGTVAGLMLFSRPVHSWVESWRHEHDRMAHRIRPPTGWRALGHKVRSKLTGILSAGFVAYLITLPLVAWHFGQVNPWAIVCGAALEILVSASLIAALFKAVLTLLIPPLASPLASLAAIPCVAMRQVVGWMAHWPGAQFPLPPVPWWILGLYALLAAIPLLPYIKRWHLAWTAPVTALALGLMLPLWSTLYQPDNGANLRLTAISVGNGSCMLLELPGKRSMMIDCGAMFQPKLFENTIAPVLRSRGVTRISRVLLTHEDMDHTSALADLQAAFAPVVSHHMTLGTSFDEGPVHFEVLAPAAGSTLTGNDASAILKLTFAGRSILFTGDVEEEGIRRLLSLEPELRADILIAPHHGSAVPNTLRLLDTVNPNTTIASSGARLTGRQLKFNALCKSPPLRTGQNGAITLTITASGETNVATYR
jgi:competence protein ComEC